MKQWNSHGDGKNNLDNIGSLGKNVVIEDGVRIFFSENIIIGDNVYIGHDTIIKAYFNQKLIIGNGTWIGPQCFIYASGGIIIGENIGIGPGVKIMSSAHPTKNLSGPILHRPLEFKRVVLKDGCDIGANSIIVMGVTIGKQVQIGAGAVVTKDIPDFSIAAGVPARVISKKSETVISV